MAIEYTVWMAPFERELVVELAQLARFVFADPGLHLEWRIASMPNVSATIARADGAVVGFKLGYAMTESKYYGWLGGVQPTSRRRGIARGLLRAQHQWIRDSGYALVESSADQNNVAMARLNLQEGFTVCGTRCEPGRVETLFMKTWQ